MFKGNFASGMVTMGVWRFPGVGEVRGAGPSGAGGWESWSKQTAAPAHWLQKAAFAAVPAAEAPHGDEGTTSGVDLLQVCKQVQARRRARCQLWHPQQRQLQ